MRAFLFITTLTFGVAVYVLSGRAEPNTTQASIVYVINLFFVVSFLMWMVSLLFKKEKNTPKPPTKKGRPMVQYTAPYKIDQRMAELIDDLNLPDL